MKNNNQIMNWRLLLGCCLLVIVVASAFYIVYPKYYINVKTGQTDPIVRLNRITGSVDVSENGGGYWTHY